MALPLNFQPNFIPLDHAKPAAMPTSQPAESVGPQEIFHSPSRMITNFAAAAMEQQQENLLRQSALRHQEAVPTTKLGKTQGDLQQAGVLVLFDKFNTSQVAGASEQQAKMHGHEVADSARGVGFKGNIIQSPMEGRPNNVAEWDVKLQLCKPQQNPENTRELISQASVLAQVSLLTSCTRRLEGLHEAGLHHSAVNFSLGEEPAEIAFRLYRDASPAWHTQPNHIDQKASITAYNYAQAFDLDFQKLMNRDLEVSGPERQKLQQCLAEHVLTSLDSSPQLKEAKAGYEAVLQELRGNHNSVVVSAGNAGEIPEYLAADAGGLKMKPPAGFFDNVLVNSQTTAVGATRGGKVAEYSSSYDQVALYADGVASSDGSSDSEGTSFASPRVAAVMAKLHELYPDKTSQQVETMVKEQLTEQLLDYDGKVERPVLTTNTLSQGFFIR